MRTIEAEDETRYGSDFWEDEDDRSEVGGSDFWPDSEEDDGCYANFWEDGDDVHFDKNLEDEESYEPESSEQDKSKAPLTKKAKTSHVAASPSNNARKKTSLSLLPTIPLDLFFEIFSHLSPMDIISLSHSSKVFYETLSSRNSPAVWKSVRKRLSVPHGPDWMSEEAWADLLFGHKCQSCGENNTKVVDFLLLKRICVWCKKQHYVLHHEIEKRYPNFEFVVHLVPSTNSFPWNNWDTYKCYYWEFDLDSMVNKLTALKKDPSSQLLHCFMMERRRRLECIYQNLPSWHRGHKKILRNRAKEKKDTEQWRLEQITEKFKEMGYTEEDLKCLQCRKTCRGSGKTQLTAKIWSRIRPTLEPEVEAEKAQRLERQLGKCRYMRRRVLAARYEEFQRTLHPSQWRYLPRTMEIAAFESFSRHLEADVGIEVKGATFDDAFLEFPRLLASAAEQRKSTLRALIGNTQREFDGEICPDSIDLATAVFQCVESHNSLRSLDYLFGWDEIASHHCLPEVEGTYYPRTTPSELKYIPEVAYVVRILAQLVGLDVASATAADFDDEDKRFVCESCSLLEEEGPHLQLVYTWRDLAVHLATKHKPILFIKVLSDHARYEVKQCERNDRKWYANRWTCSHCPEYLDDLQTRQTIVEHLYDSHAIQVPSEPTDLFFFERSKNDWTTISIFAAPAINPVRFQCPVCIPNTEQLFSLNGLESHLQAKHDSTSGKNGGHLALT